MENSSRSMVLSACIVAFASGCGCKSRQASESAPPSAAPVYQESAASEPGTSAHASRGIFRAANEVLDRLAFLESENDVTCWTSFRQLDWYISEKIYDEVATLAKVVAVKALVRETWARASVRASETSDAQISASTMRAAVVLPDVALPRSSGAAFVKFRNDLGVKNYSDYQKTAEHWRVVLAVLQDEIAESGGISGLKTPSTGALDALADMATTMSLLLLKESSAAASRDQKERIGGAQVASAYVSLSHKLGLESEARARKPLPDSIVKEQLKPLTRRLIDGKFRALVAFNGAGAAGRGSLDTRLLADLNRIARVPMTARALSIFRRQLQSFVHFVAAGYLPMRADNYLSDGSFVQSRMRGKKYLGVSDVQNVVLQLFPYQMMNNGDIVVRFEPNPGPIAASAEESRKSFEIRILDHEMNGVRDSGIHWLAARTVWDERTYAMDPFAAEYLTEVVSMMMATWMRRAEQIATKMGITQVDGRIARRVQSKGYVMVQPERDGGAQWSARNAQARKLAVAEYGARGYFRDVSAYSGLPTSLPGYGAEGEPTVEASAAAPSASKIFDLQTIMGGGIAVGDLNGDGYDDLYLGGEGLGRLYLNLGKGSPGKFVDSTSAWGLPVIGDAHGTLFFDFEGDGDQDLLVLRSTHPSELFLQEDGRLVAAAKRLKFHPHYGAQVAHVFDYDQDGDLDVYVGYYGSATAHRELGKTRSLPSMDGRNGSPNELWRNDGAFFTEVGARAGVDDVGWALAVGSFDYDGDGNLDMYVANDFGANVMYRNRGDGRFEDVTLALGTGDRGSGMNVDVSDVNGDGKWDFYVTNIDMFSKNIKVVFPRDDSVIDVSESLTKVFQYLTGNKLYVSDGKGGFVAQEGERFEPHDRGWGWDAAFIDADNDGDQDLYLANGWVHGSYAGGQKNQFYLNHEGAFYLAPEGAESFSGNTRSCAVVDIDNDGDLDLVTNNFRTPPKVLRNDVENKNRWLRLVLRGGGANPSAIGARVVVSAGGRTFMQHSSGGRGYLSQSSSVILLGVGRAKRARVTVYWPDGKVSETGDLISNRSHLVVEP